MRLSLRSREVSEKEIAEVIGWRYGLSKSRRLRFSSKSLRMREGTGSKGFNGPKAADRIRYLGWMGEDSRIDSQSVWQ